MAKKQHSSGPPPVLPEGVSDDIGSGNLLLDPGNLRLLERHGDNLSSSPVRTIGQPAIQKRLQEILAKDELFNLPALSKSIATNGFLKHERLIVAPYDGANYLVLEGNRRLAAVRELERNPQFNELSHDAKQSLRTLPCFVLKGSAIDGFEDRLTGYRQAADVYIGMRHLMGAKSWEPASRYEFQWRLIESGWTIEQVADRFGRKKSEVDRDLRAQRLYRDFHRFEKRNKTSHSLTYNVFNEAARAPAISKWLGWSKSDYAIENVEHEEAFFRYLITRLHAPTKQGVLEGEEISPEESAETIVRRLREMLKLNDADIEGALLDSEFEQAEFLFDERKEGSLEKRLSIYVRALGRITISELEKEKSRIRQPLRLLIEQAERLEKLLNFTKQKKG